MKKFTDKIKKKDLLSKTCGELDYEKNAKKLDRKLNIRIIGGIFGIILTLLILMTFMTKKSMEGFLSGNMERELTYIRDMKADQIQGYYENIGYEMKAQLENYINYPQYGLSDSKKNHYLELGVEDIYLMDRELSVLYHEKEGEDILPIKKILGEIKFEDPFFIGDIDFEDEEIFQYVHYKVFKDSKAYYLTFKLNTRHLESLLKNLNFDVDILNKDYFVVSSTSKENKADVQIDDVTKKMLSGRTGIDKIENIIYSYSFIDLDESSLFIKAYLDENIYKGDIDNYLKIVTLIWIFSITGGFFVVFLLKNSVNSYSQSKSRMELEKAGDEKYGFLKREFIEVFDNLDCINDSLNKISDFTESLALLKERVISQNQNLMTKIEDEKKVIKNIKEDESLRKKVSEEIKVMK